MGDNSNYLMHERDGEEKAFSVGPHAIGGKSGREDYDKYDEFKASSDVARKCMMMATAYTETMLTRAKVEDPEIFAMKGMSKSEM